VNFSDVEDFEALPEGEYAVEIDKVEVRRNKADDGDYLNWEFVVLDGDYENRRLWLITSLKPQALFRLKDVLEQLDLLEGDEMELEWDDDQDVTSSSGPRLLYPDVEGMEASIRVKNETFDGKERNRVDSVFTGRKKSRDKKTTRRSADDSRRTRSRSRRDEEEYDVDEDDDDEEEEEESPRRSSRQRTTGRQSRERDTDSERSPRSRRSERSSGRRRLR
jgi:hypothetical protein